MENKKKKVSAIMRRRFGLSVDNSALVTKATPTTAVPNLTSPLIDPPREAESMKIIWRIHIVRFLFGSQQVSSQEWMSERDVLVVKHAMSITRRAPNVRGCLQSCNDFGCE